MATLTMQQIEELRQKLRQELTPLVAQTSKQMRSDEKTSYIDIATNVPDAADEAMADTMVDTENALIGRHLQQIRDIDAALERIQLGVYGICMNCGCEIGIDRLIAYPTAKRCIECQSQREKTFASESMVNRSQSMRMDRSKE